MLFSWPFLYAVLFAQWSPLLCAMWFVPWLAPLVLCKPNIALPFVLTGRVGWVPVAVGVAVLAVSLGWKPEWPWVWLEQTRSYQGMTPPLAMLPLGPLILLSLFAWRDRQAWLVLTLAVMPQRVFYDIAGPGVDAGRLAGVDRGGALPSGGVGGVARGDFRAACPTEPACYHR